MKTISVIAVLAMTLLCASTAFAQSSVEGYNNSAGQVQNEVAAVGQGGGGGGSLPFTGLDIALLVGAGGLLAGAGYGMRRLTRAPDAT